jgi:riboflavin kinase/FMN adenylyltransferase
MQVHYDYKNIRFRKPVVTMGVFDGVHLGHRMLLRRVTEEAASRGSDAVAVTFDPHPRIVLTGDPSHLRFLTDIEERVDLMRATGIDHLVIIPFTRELSRMTACEFVEAVLFRHLGVSHLVTGFDHHFGNRHKGNSTTVTDCSARLGFSVSREEAFMIAGEAVSSTGIRRVLERGEVKKAAMMLGYEYSVRGRVVSGKRIGRNIGFPTANISPHFRYKLIPASGVYAVEVLVENDPQWHIAMLNIGLRPTISDSDGQSTIEAHLIDFGSDLYGKNVTVRFRERLRDEMKFENVEALVAQLQRDREMTLRLLRSSTGTVR